MRDTEEYILPVMLSVIIVMLLTASALVLCQPFFEAKSFNKITGKNVTAWDAMWLELRVDGCKP